MLRNILILWAIPTLILGSEIPDLERPSHCKNVNFFLSTPKSGTNLISSSLSAITRKPIWWVNWKRGRSDAQTPKKEHPSYNRLKLPLVSEKPLLYRTHYNFDLLNQVSSSENRLIFVTRNPKELLFRAFYLKHSRAKIPDLAFIHDFLNRYLLAFDTYLSWNKENRFIVFYEDFIRNGDQILIQLLDFMKEAPLFLQDFLDHKQEYMARLLESYKEQHWHNSGGISTSNGKPREIYYSQNAPIEVLQYIDDYIANNNPQAWDDYLIRFALKKTDSL